MRQVIIAWHSGTVIVLHLKWNTPVCSVLSFQSGNDWWLSITSLNKSNRNQVGHQQDTPQHAEGLRKNVSKVMHTLQRRYREHVMRA